MRVEVGITVRDDAGAIVIQRTIAVEGEMEDLVNIAFARLAQEMVNRIKSEAGLDPV